MIEKGDRVYIPETNGRIGKVTYFHGDRDENGKEYSWDSRHVFVVDEKKKDAPWSGWYPVKDLLKVEA